MYVFEIWSSSQSFCHGAFYNKRTQNALYCLAHMISIELSPKNPFHLFFASREGRHNLAVTNFEELAGSSEAAQDLLRTTMVMHLIAPDFPHVIETNFELADKSLIDRLYHHYGQKNPRIFASRNQIDLDYGREDKPNVHADYVNAHSGGLDSTYRATKLVAAGKSVLAVHLKNLNPKGTSLESRASKAQAEAWGIPHKELQFINGSRNYGSNMMRTRDLLVATATALVGLKAGAKEVQIEGDFVRDKAEAQFSEYEGTWDMFSILIKKLGLNIEVKGIDAGDIETIGELIKLEKVLDKPILDLVQNCFSAPFQLPGIRRKWEKAAPGIATASSEHWCGSCLKCRRMTLGRLYYHDPKFDRVPTSEVKFFVDDTYRWMKLYPEWRGMISDSFMIHLGNLTDQWGI